MSANEDLVAACNKKDVKGAAAALAAGASPDATDPEGMSVLNTACVLKSKALAKLLLEAGANVNATDEDGRAALHWLAEDLPEADLAALCIAKGANVDALDTGVSTMSGCIVRCSAPSSTSPRRYSTVARTSTSRISMTETRR